MLAEMLFGFGAALFLIRIFKAEAVGLKYCAVDMLSALMVGVSGYFWLFPGVATTITGNVITQTIPTAIQVFSPGFILLIAFLGSYVMICLLWCLKDFANTRKIKQ